MNLAALFLLVSQTYGLPEGLLHSVCMVESHHRVDAIRHDDGKEGSTALGICQMHLNTAKYLAKKYNRKTPTAKDLMRPEINIDFAGLYLRDRINIYKGDVSRGVTAYNQGKSYSHGGSAYAAKVFNELVRYHRRESEKRRIDSEGGISHDAPSESVPPSK